jgi:hypothetical protein
MSYPQLERNCCLYIVRLFRIDPKYGLEAAAGDFVPQELSVDVKIHLCSGAFLRQGKDEKNQAVRGVCRKNISVGLSNVTKVNSLTGVL